MRVEGAVLNDKRPPACQNLTRKGGQNKRKGFGKDQAQIQTIERRLPASVLKKDRGYRQEGSYWASWAMVRNSGFILRAKGSH